jgi:hypothetical protein
MVVVAVVLFRSSGRSGDTRASEHTGDESGAEDGAKSHERSPA